MFKKIRNWALVSMLSVAAFPAVAQEVTWQVPTSVPEAAM